MRPKRGTRHPGNVLCTWGRNPNGNRTPQQDRSPRPPRSMAAEAARRQPRPRWTMAGNRPQLTRQQSAAAPSSAQQPPRRHSMDSSTADHYSSRDRHTAPHDLHRGREAPRHQDGPQRPQEAARRTAGSQPDNGTTDRQEGTRSRPRWTGSPGTISDRSNPGRIPAAARVGPLDRQQRQPMFIL